MATSLATSALADAIHAQRTVVDGLSPDDLESLSGVHILFKDDAPQDVMVDFWLRKRLAEERLRALRTE